MKKILILAIMLAVMFCLSGCHIKGDDVKQVLDDVAGRLGNSQITEEEDLIGMRVLEKDSYTGKYEADCKGNTGRDVIFGGGSIETRKLHVYGTIDAEEGKAVVRIRLNEEVRELYVDENGEFKTDLSMESGGNYIMIDYEEFQGSVELISEYK